MKNEQPAAGTAAHAEVDGSDDAKGKHVACNLCGSGSYRVLFEAGVAQLNRIVECRECSLMFASPRLGGADVDSIAAYDPEEVLIGVSKWDAPRLQKEMLQVRDYAPTRTFLQKRLPARGKLLEVGSGMGYLSDYFRKDGWDVVGVEPNLGLSRYAHDQLGLNVLPTTLEGAALEASSLDVALMMHVIEHVPDPLGTLREVARVLKPGGHFVVETPTYDSLMFRLLGRRERSLSCDGHIYFFTRRTLAQLARVAGFEVLKMDTVGRSMTLDRFAYNLGVVSKSTAVKRALTKSSEWLRLDKMQVTLNLHDMIRAYLWKPG